jgi:hypothetical protein
MKIISGCFFALGYLFCVLNAGIQFLPTMPVNESLLWSILMFLLTESVIKDIEEQK